MMKYSKLKFSDYMQNISRSKIFGKFVLIVYVTGNETLKQCWNCKFDFRKYFGPIVPVL